MSQPLSRVLRGQAIILVLVSLALAAPLMSQQRAETELVEVIPSAGAPAPPPAATAATRGLLMLRNRTVDVARVSRANAAQFTADAQTLQGLGVNDAGYYVVKFAPEVRSEAARAQIAAVGGSVVGYVPYNGYMVRATGSAVQRLGAQPNCELAIAYHPVDRIAPEVSHLMNGKAVLEGKDVYVTVNIITFRGEDDARITSALADLGVVVSDFAGDFGCGAIYRTTCLTSQIPWIASISGVQWIEPWLPRERRNDFATGSGSSGTDILNVGDLASTYSLDGSNMVVGHADTGLDIGVNSTALHRDFLNAAGTATRITLARGWGLRTTATNWMDTYATSGSSYGGGTGPMYYRDSFSATRSGVIRAVTFYLVRNNSSPTGTIQAHLYKTTTPAPNGIAGTPGTVSSTVVRADDVAVGYYTGYTFFFDTAPTVASGDTWYVVLDLSAVTGYADLPCMLKSSGSGLSYGNSGASSWTAQSGYDLMCRVYDELSWDDIDAHGTHTLGSILGNGLRYTVGGQGRYRGAAFAANFVHQSVEDSSGYLSGLPASLWPLFQEAYDNGARIHSDSWGSKAYGAYDSTALSVDNYVWNRQDFLPVFAAGNDGQDGRWVEPYPITTATEQALNTYGSPTQARCSFRFACSVTSVFNSVTLQMRRSSTVAGTIAVYVASDNGSGTAPSSFYGPVGTISASSLPYSNGTTSDYQAVTFRSSPVALGASPSGYLWVTVYWTNGTGSVSGNIYVRCDGAAVSNNYAYYNGSTYVNVSNRQAPAYHAGGDGVVDLGSIESPGLAKNCLCVGATETKRDTNTAGYATNYQTYQFSSPIGGDSYFNNISGMAAFSSRGPTSDGRLKPDICAPGTYIASCRTQRLPPLVSYDVETANATWTTTGLWSRSNSYGAHTGSYAYRVAGNGGGTTTNYLTYGANIDLSATGQSQVDGGPYLWFWVNATLTGTGDQLRLELSSDAGSSWSDNDGTSFYWRRTTDTGGWMQVQVAIPGLYKTSNQFQFRLRFYDYTGTGQGTALIDDLTVWMPNGAWGRLNDMAASGWNDYTGNANNYYMFSCGTSMATPLTAGVATLVREYYVEKKLLTNPPAALVKATMINEAVDMNPGQYGTGASQEMPARPNNVEGWGRVNAKGCLYRTAPRVGGYVNADALSSWRFTGTGQTRTIDIAVPNIAGNLNEPIKATLAWTDRPGTLGAATQLVNDLDLRVDRYATDTSWNRGAVVQSWYGNGVATGDRVNNIEGVDIAAPVTWGWYRVTVTCQALPQGGEQTFALVLSGGFTNDPQVTPVEVEDLSASRTGPHDVIVQWRPVAGIDALGYHVYRATREDGPFERLTDQPVEADGGPCRFVDRAAPGRRSYYRLGVVDARGAVKHTEVVSETPRR